MHYYKIYLHKIYAQKLLVNTYVKLFHTAYLIFIFVKEFRSLPVFVQLGAAAILVLAH